MSSIGDRAERLGPWLFWLALAAGGCSDSGEGTSAKGCNEDCDAGSGGSATGDDASDGSGGLNPGGTSAAGGNPVGAGGTTGKGGASGAGGTSSGNGGTCCRDGGGDGGSSSGDGGTPNGDGGKSSGSGGKSGGSGGKSGGSGGATGSGGSSGGTPGCGDGNCAGAESCGTCALDCAPCGTSVCTTGNCVTVTDTVLHQTILGWEATAQAGQNTATFDNYSDQLIDRAANELGINRLRVEVRSVKVVGGDFDLAPVDSQMTDVAVPLRAALAARGERLWINVCVVGNELKDNPTKYAAQALALVKHMETTYGVVPDSWEVALEPDVFGWNDPLLVGNALVAAGKLLAQNGYHPDFVAPSNTSAARVPSYVDVMEDIPDIFDHWRELSYHRYDYPDASELQAIAALAKKHNLRTSMLEHIDSGHADLFADLTDGNVSAWQQYTLAFPAGSDNAAQYYWPTSGGTVLTLADRARYLRQYFAYVRPGAVRVDTASTRSTLKPTAFITPDNRYVVVMNTAGSLTMGVAGLPAGTYGVTYTTGSDTHTAGPDLTVTPGSTAVVTIPSGGVITVFEK